MLNQRKENHSHTENYTDLTTPKVHKLQLRINRQ